MRYPLVIGFTALLVLMTALAIYMGREEERMQSAQADLRTSAVSDASAVYVQYCATCHGATGEGIGANPALDSDGVRGMDYDTLYKTIARGRYGTAMTGWHVDEGGILTTYEIDQLVALVRYADWPQVRELAAQQGMIPVSLAVPEVDAGQIEAISALGPEGSIWASGLNLYAQNCTTCHGASGEGSSLAVALNTPELRSQDAATISRTISEGVAGTMMAAWNMALQPEEISALTEFLLHWDQVEAAGIALSVPTLEQIDLGDAEAVLALGERLFTTTCTTCHGENGSGGIGPAINSQQFLSRKDDAAIEQTIIEGGHRSNTGMPAFGDRLTSVEITALVRYIRSLEATAPSVANPRGTQQGGGGPPWLRGTTTPDASDPNSSTESQQHSGGGPPPWAGGGGGGGQ